MRILYHHRTRADDGQAVHIRSLQQAFREEGHEVHEVGLVQQGAGPDAASANGASPAARPGASDGGRSRWGWVSRLPRFALELAEYAYTVPARRRLAREAALLEPDFVYERYAFGNAGGVLAARRAGLPLVLEVNSPMVLELSRTRGLSFPRIARRMEEGIFRGATRVCVVTEVLAGMLAEMGVPRERLLVTPNGVHLEQYTFEDRAEARRAAREALGLPAQEDDGPVLGFVGYYRDWHRLDLVIDALSDGALKGSRLALIGTGPAHDSLLERARRSGVQERVHFCGPRAHADIPALLTAFDIALVPAINPYASPLKLHEYMAAGLPVIAPDQPNLREVVVHDRTALLVPPGDGDALRAALTQLASSADDRARLGSAARATIEERDLTWRANARRVVASVEQGAS